MIPWDEENGIFEGEIDDEIDDLDGFHCELGGLLD